MALRRIIIPIDSVLDLFKSYTSENHDIPTDALPVTLMVKQSEQGKFAIIAESPEWTRDSAPLNINFDIRRMIGAL
jgi:hypothetical protein